ncbi:hypothetical protein ATE92_0928 [Ulvibacter sp. MAR_2010_11]|nr:hypothetical protein ATE92_0928 [Ulvibacter sp. MAR_2010_11]
MKIEVFNKLNKFDKFDFLCDYGIFLCAKKELNKKFLLYSVDNYFVEEEWDYPNKRIVAYRSFVDDSLLDEYYQILRTTMTS